MSHESTNVKRSSGDCLKTGKAVIQHLSEMTLFLNCCIFSGGAEALVRCGGKLQHLLIAWFLRNTCAKYYENPTMFSRVIAKDVGDVFLRHTVGHIRDDFYRSYDQTNSVKALKEPVGLADKLGR